MRVHTDPARDQTTVGRAGGERQRAPALATALWQPLDDNLGVTFFNQIGLQVFRVLRLARQQINGDTEADADRARCQRATKSYRGASGGQILASSTCRAGYQPTINF